MKFLIHGNAPTVKTGYGVQIANLVTAMNDDGQQPACSSTYGIQGGVTTWRDTAGRATRVYGCGYDVNSNDRMHMHARHWFGDDPGWIITVLDVWALKNPLLDQFNVAAWVPIDHFTSVGPQPNVKDFFDKSKAVPIAMSRFGENLLLRAGLDPVYIPLSVDTSVYKPTATLPGGKTWRQMEDIPEDAFVVGMVAMNKGWARDRKGFNEAFWAFANFERDHPDAYLYVHADAPGGAEGIDLYALSTHSGIPPQKIKFAGGPDQYGYYLGYTPDAMAAMYTGFDVLLAPSHGEGFCVPIVEAQACGTPVIATNFSAQAELVPESVGWLCEGQPEWDPSHLALYKVPLIGNVIDRLEEAYDADRASMVQDCIDFAHGYDTQVVYDTYWRPFIAELEEVPEKPALDRDPMPDTDAVAVICPIYQRTEHVLPLIDSFMANTEPGEATLYFMVGDTDREAMDAALAEGTGPAPGRAVRVLSAGAESCASKWNDGYASTEEPWVLLIGDDVRFTEGWLDNARKLSADYDIIGTNDSRPGRIRNKNVANGSHADHFFVRRAYVEEYGACLDGPGKLAPEVYRHWFVDMEMITLAKARGVFTPCLDSVVEHLHPGYDGREDLRMADPTYKVALASSAADEKKFKERAPLIEMQRTGRTRI